MSDVNITLNDETKAEISEYGPGDEVCVMVKIDSINGTQVAGTVTSIEAMEQEAPEEASTDTGGGSMPKAVQMASKMK